MKAGPSAGVLALTAGLVLASSAWAREVTVPVELDEQLVRGFFVRQVFTGPEGDTRLWDDGNGCNFLTLGEPEVDIRDGRVHVLSPGQARIGTLVFGFCLTALDWSGFVEVVEEPELEPGTAVVGFRIVDSNLYGPKREKQVASGVLWDWVKDYVHPRLSTVKIDLGGPLADVRSLLPLFLPNENASRLQTMLDSLALADLQAADGKLAAKLRFDVPDGDSPSRTAEREPTLTGEELRAWEDAYQSWDAFVTFVVKHAGRDTEGLDVRTDLFSVLIQARYELLEALAPEGGTGEDPVRKLFVETWNRLSPLLRNVGASLLPESALHYVAFVAGADALAALDDIGPDVGLEISSDGLRRLARIVAPSAPDPLAFDFEVDPDLRLLFGFGPPLDVPPPNPDVDTSGSTIEWLRDLLLARAWAVDAAALSRLSRWVPTRAELPEYLPLVRDLLKQTAEATLARRTLAPPFPQMYRWLIYATAWKESCWRQFVREGPTIKPITSSVGAVGLMQINQRVWRGLYNVQSLRGDVAYNAKAGAEIAIHYLADYALKKGEHKTGDLENAARATYCIYNGGPGAIRRYRNPKASREGRKIDEKFWQIFKDVKAGRELEVASCWG